MEIVDCYNPAVMVDILLGRAGMLQHNACEKNLVGTAANATCILLSTIPPV